jgi:hypothetical protein
MAVAVAACTLVAFLKVTLEGDSFYQTLKIILAKNIIFKPSYFYRNGI